MGGLRAVARLMVGGWRPDKAEVDDLTKEFIAESQEGLERMERCLTELEKRPGDGELVAEIFRAVHTIKGTTGFLGFGRLEKLAHAGEDLLGELREGKLAVTADLIGGLLDLMDGLRAILRLIEATGSEGLRSSDDDGELIGQLADLRVGTNATREIAVSARAARSLRGAQGELRSGRRTGGASGCECGGVWSFDAG